MLLVADGHAVVLPESRDHKRLLDADLGPNTGGMGAFSPVLEADDPLHARIADEIVGPTVRGLVTDGLAYRGFLYVGLMLTPDGPKVLEFNVRFGDPEAQAVLPRIDGSFAELCLACAKGTLAGKKAAPRAIHALAVVLAREGYPRAPVGEPTSRRATRRMFASQALEKKETRCCFPKVVCSVWSVSVRHARLQK
jgi:phosphoribosylamine--glycine ligase